MMQVILSGIIIAATHAADTEAAESPQLLKNLQGVWRIEGVSFSRPVENTPLARSFQAKIGDYVVWDAEYKLLVGLPHWPFVKTVFRPERKDAPGLWEVELRQPNSNSFIPGILLIKERTLLLCYSCYTGKEFPRDFDLDNTSRSLILVTLGRTENHEAVEASRRVVAQMQGVWELDTIIATDDQGELSHGIDDLRGSRWVIRGNVIHSEVPARKKTYELPFAINAAHQPVRIYTKDFCGIMGFDNEGRLKIAAYKNQDFVKAMVPRKLDPPERLDEVGPRTLYLVFRRVQDSKP
jgi:hypothetical protein